VLRTNSNECKRWHLSATHVSQANKKRGEKKINFKKIIIFKKYKLEKVCLSHKKRGKKKR
jgi:hypothetical protein